MPPMFYSLLLTWFRSLRMAGWLRRLIGGVVLAVISVACLPYFLHAGPAPAWLGEFAGQLAANQGMQMQVKEMRLEGWGRAVLDDVVLQPNSQLPEVEEVSAERVVMIFDWLPLMRGEVPQVREVRIEKPMVTAALPSVAPISPEPSAEEPDVTRPKPHTTESHEPAAIEWNFPIRFQVREGRLQLHDEAFGNLTAEFDIKGTLLADSLQVDQWRLDVQGERIGGALRGVGQAQWGNGAFQLAGSAQGERIHFAVGEDVYRIAQAEADYRFNDGIWLIEALGRGRAGSRVDVSGTISMLEGMDLDINASGLDLAADIPLVGRYGFDGESTFSGTLSGPFYDFVLQGDATIGQGRVWGRPHQWAEGYIAVTPEHLVFSDVRVLQEVGRYDLDGVFMFARAAEAFPGYLEIALEARAGKLIDLLSILEADGLPLSGRLNGTLAFAGPLGSIGASGDVEVLDAEVWGQPFDQISGVFAWHDGQFQLHEVRAALGSGRLQADGVVMLGDDRESIDLRFAAADWPLGDIRAFEENFGQVAGGRIDVVDGRLTGSLAEPLLAAQVTSDGLRLGPTAFYDVHGIIRASATGLSVEGLTAMRSGGGVYQITGAFRPDAAEQVVTETTVTVEGEELRDLLQLIGQPLPAALVNGPIRGEIAVSGNLAQPHAKLNLLWADTVEGTSGIELVIVLEEDELRVERFGYMKNQQTA